MVNRNPDYDHNLHTNLPAAIKAKITEYRKACDMFSMVGSYHPDDRAGIVLGLQVARYNLETVILTHLRRNE